MIVINSLCSKLFRRKFRDSASLALFLLGLGSSAALAQFGEREGGHRDEYRGGHGRDVGIGVGIGIGIGTAIVDGLNKENKTTTGREPPARKRADPKPKPKPADKPNLRQSHKLHRNQSPSRSQSQNRRRHLSCRKTPRSIAL